MNLASTLSVYGYGTHEGVEKEWDTRGRGRKTAPVVEKGGNEVFYHGTVLPSAKAILKEGLRGKAEKAFNVGAIPSSKRGYVYITKDPALAKTFARARAAYDKAAPGSKFTFKNDYLGHGVSQMYKRPGASALSEEAKDDIPAVVEIDVPADVAKQFKEDPDWAPPAVGAPEVAFIKRGIIPKKYVKKVSVLQDTGDWKDFGAKDLAAGSDATTFYLVYVGPLATLKKHLNDGESK